MNNPETPHTSAQLALDTILSAVGIYPDMPWENVKTDVESIPYYRTYGRKGL